MANWQDSARRQLASVGQLGVSALEGATELSALRRQKAEQQRQAAQLAQIQKAQQQAQQQAVQMQTSMTSPVAGLGGGVAPITGGGNFDRFVKALVGQESGGNYKAVNRSSGALGKYQIMPGNVASWSRAALGRSITPQQFLASPQLQDQVARHQLKQYFDKYGAQGAAVAWYAGEGTAKKYVKNPGAAAFNRPQGAYPSINSYALSILKKMGTR